MEKNFSFLSKGASQHNMPNLINTMMELRKCCNHPYLITGGHIHTQTVASVYQKVQRPLRRLTLSCGESRTADLRKLWAAEPKKS